MEAKTVKVCITYVMSKGQWESAENCVTCTITKSAYDEIVEELARDCWSTSLECEAGGWATTMLIALARLQGYLKVDGWSVELVNKEAF